MLRFQHQRAGLSLMEALVALFIMAIGMISLLTLFPLGAIQMGRALRDDRCAQCAWQADGVVRTWWQVEVVDKPGAEAAFWTALDGSGATAVANDSTNPSMVVAIDPIGVEARGLTPIVGIVPRRTSSQIASLATPQLRSTASIRACTMVDDLFFNEIGTPDNQSAVTNDLTTGKKQIVRQGRYNWLAFVQRPVNRDRYAVNMKILVFDGRAPGTVPANGEGLLTIPATTPQTGLAGQTQVIVNSDPSNPNSVLSKGGWVLDCGNGSRMNFHRIQSLTPSGTQSVLELDTPLKNDVNITGLIVFRGLAEVFDRPMLAPTGYLNPQP